MQNRKWEHKKQKIKLFCILPIYEYKETPTKREWRILGIPGLIARKRRPISTTRNYYLFGFLRLMKISQKEK